MSESATCDVCKRTVRRRRGTIAPEGWSYGESDMTNDDGVIEDTFIVYACSAACREAFWKQGPGKLDLEEYVLRPVGEKET